MKNIYELLTEIGLTVPEDKKAVFDKALLENYKTVADYDKQAGKLQLAEDKVKTTADALKKFEGVDVAALQGEISKLQGELTTKDTTYQSKLADMEFGTLLDSAITGAKGKNAKAIKALLDADALKASKNQSEDIKTALETLKKENDYLFENAQTPPPYAGGTGSNPPNNKYSPEDAALRSAMGLKTE